jgi:hypothetical protein
VSGFTAASENETEEDESEKKQKAEEKIRVSKAVVDVLAKTLMAVPAMETFDKTLEHHTEGALISGAELSTDKVSEIFTVGDMRDNKVLRSMVRFLSVREEGERR